MKRSRAISRPAAAIGTVLSVTGIVVMGSSGAGWAQPPMHDLQSRVLPACGVQMREDVTLYGEIEHDKPTKSGAIRITGVLKIRYTNIATGQSVLVNASGPGTLAFTDSTAVLNSFGTSVGVSEVLVPGHVLWQAGPSMVEWRLSDGAVVAVDAPAVYRDLCPLLT